MPHVEVIGALTCESRPAVVTIRSRDLPVTWLDPLQGEVLVV